MVNKRRSHKFYEALKHEASDEGKAEINVLSIPFDYMQHLLPSQSSDQISPLIPCYVICPRNEHSEILRVALWHP